MPRAYGTPLPPGMRRRRWSWVPRDREASRRWLREHWRVASGVSGGVVLALAVVASVLLPGPAAALDAMGDRLAVGPLSFRAPANWFLVPGDAALDQPWALFAPGGTDGRPPLVLTVASLAEDRTAAARRQALLGAATRQAEDAGVDPATVLPPDSYALLVGLLADDWPGPGCGAGDPAPFDYAPSLDSVILLRGIRLHWDCATWRPIVAGPAPDASPDPAATPVPVERVDTGIALHVEQALLLDTGQDGGSSAIVLSLSYPADLDEGTRAAALRVFDAILASLRLGS